MADRNDALLLTLGWKQIDPDPSGWPYTWIDPSGEAVEPADAPRPYDNLQDALACVPEGWRVRQIEEMMDGDWLAQLSLRYKPGFVKVRGATPAEALAEAISKAVSHD